MQVEAVFSLKTGFDPNQDKHFKQFMTSFIITFHTSAMCQFEDLAILVYNNLTLEKGIIHFVT